MPLSDEGIFYIKQHNTLDPLRVTLLDSSRKPIIGNFFVGASCNFRMRPEGDNSRATVDGSAALIQNTDSSWDAEYDWVADDTAVAGTFYGEFVVTTAGGGVKSFPDPGIIPVVITAAVGG